jgi:hypothetical protein
MNYDAANVYTQYPTQLTRLHKICNVWIQKTFNSVENVKQMTVFTFQIGAPGHNYNELVYMDIF